MKNFIRKGEKITVTGPSGGLSAGDPYMVGSIPCVCDVDIAHTGTGAASIKGVFSLLVNGTDNSGVDGSEAPDDSPADAAVTVGAKLYYPGTAVGGGLSLETEDTIFFGYALGAVDAGSSGVIDVFIK